MANQFSTRTTNAGNLKNYYISGIRSQLNDDLKLWSGMQKGDEKWSGLQVIRAWKVRRNQGVGASADGSILPAIGFATTVQAVIPAKLNYLRTGISGPMIKSSQSDKGSFVREQGYQLEQGYIDLKNSLNRQLGWDGTGKLASLSASAVASTVISITGRESTEVAAKFLDVGQVIDIISSAGAVVAQGITISAIADQFALATTVTLGSAVTCSSTDIIVQSGSYNAEIQGLLTQQDGLTTSLFGVDRSVYQSTQGNVLNAGGAQLSLDAMEQTCNLARVRGGDEADIVYCDFNSERMYNKLLVANIRYNFGGSEGRVMGDGTFTVKGKAYLQFGGRPVIADKDCPTRFFFLSMGDFKKYVLADLEYAAETGAEWIAQPEADQLEARLRYFANMFCEKPAASAVLRNYVSP